MEAALRKMDAMLASTVQAITNTLPASANEGDLFLVGTAPTGVAAGWANRVARWRASPSGWEAYVPMEGWIVTIVGETTDKIRRYNGTAWAPIGNDVSMGAISGLTASLDAKLDAANPVFTGTMTGPTLVAGTLISPTLFAAEPTGASAVVAWGTGAGAAASMRWKLLKEGTAELGSDVGSDLVLNSYSDSGAFIEAVLRAPRAAGGKVTIYRPLKLASSLSGTGTRPLVALSDGTIDDQDASTFRSTIGAAPAPSRATISASTSLGGISASAIYIPATDVNLTLDGGFDSQGWDIYSTLSFGLVVPSGTSLYAYNGIDTGPTTRPVGGGRAIRVVRLTATIWLVPNMHW